ncbi:MAG TPA: hypothetical protein VMB26_09600 [Candidatus Binataceae bacterium]|nr:hypothetical protein [Candidatus Binataceae bacterium]
MKTATRAQELEQNNRKLSGILLGVIALLIAIAIVSILALN